MSVPVWGATLSGPLPVAGLVGHYPTNYLMGRRPLPPRLLAKPLGTWSLSHASAWGISRPFGLLFPSAGQVTYVLRTHSPLRTNIAISPAFDLHVLSTPPAFILSQDQTLRQNCTDGEPSVRRLLCRRLPPKPAALLTYAFAGSLSRFSC